MNLGLVTSFLIGGVLLISILTLNNQVNKNTAETTLTLISRNQMETVTDMISYDLSRIGFGDSSKIQQFNSTMIKFKADFFNDGSRNVQWHLTGNPANGTRNPDDVILRRVGPASASAGAVMTEIPVVYFKLTGYRSPLCENETTQIQYLECIEVKIVFESAEPAGKRADGFGIYGRTSWNKRFIPSNIQIAR